MTSNGCNSSPRTRLQLLGTVRQEYDRFIAVVTRVVELIRSGHVAEAREAQLKEARPLANRLERLTNELVNRAEADVVAVIEASGNAYRTSQTIVIAFALGAIALALVLGRTISWSLVGPIRKIDATLGEIAAGDFTRRVEVANRDELGALARQCQPDVGAARQSLPAARNGERTQIGIPRQHEPRAADAAERHPRLHRAPR